MNIVKYRPVGQPSAQVILVKLAKTHNHHHIGEIQSSKPTKKQADRHFYRNGYVRAGLRGKV